MEDTHTPRAKNHTAMLKGRYLLAAQREARMGSYYDILVKKACVERKKEAMFLNFMYGTT